MSSIPQYNETVREFLTGATRSPIGDKYQYEGFLSPTVIHRYAEYMHKHRFQVDGQIRAADNWQKGMPLESYIDSGWRHFMDWWLHHRGQERLATETLEESLCALMFNTMGYLHEVLKEKNGPKESNLLDWLAEEPRDTKYRVGFEATR